MESKSSLVSQKSSDSGLHIQLHPLVLLTISDHITRHTARRQQGPIIGALLGQQHGREITIEHVFECPVEQAQNDALLPASWFEERLKQFKDVHKVPPLDLVGWWSTASPSGPDVSHLPIHRQVLQDYNESAIFLAFHPSQLRTDSLGAKLPLTIYESVLEGESAADGSKDMQIDGEERAMNIRFRELPYSVETGEAEMIGVDTIAKGSGTASWTEPATQGLLPTGKNKKGSSQAELTQEEEELIANLNTRLNAIRTLASRISLIKSYVSSVTESNGGASSSSPQMSHTIIRNINSLIAHLSILSPRDIDAFKSEVLSQDNDVKLVSLLGQMGESIRAMRDLGRKSAIVQGARQTKQARTHMDSSALSRNFEEELFRQDMLGSRA